WYPVPRLLLRRFATVAKIAAHRRTDDTAARRIRSMSLVLKDVRKSYHEPDGQPLPILDIPEFTLQSAEQAALLGESGGGKTTLLNVIAGITMPDSGSVTIDGI